MDSKPIVLVTGGSGFVGSNVLLAALKKGYRVRTTVRSLKKAPLVKAMLKHGGATDAQAESVEFFTVDLMKDDGWAEACQGCTYVLHVASPVAETVPKHEDELVLPAREGTLRALRAATAAGTVKRVVLTSSVVAMAYGHTDRRRVYNEDDWSDLNNPSMPIPAYPKSKTVAERAAWDYMSAHGGNMEMATVNPVFVFGPMLSKDYSPSLEIIARLVNGSVPGLPQIALSIVDVRDVADLHILAMESPNATGQRYVCCADQDALYFKEVALILKNGLSPKDAKRIPTRTFPDMMVRFASWFDKALALLAVDLGLYKDFTNAKAKQELGWQPRPAREAILSAAASMKEWGLTK